jgi:hypothetical protein
MDNSTPEATPNTKAPLTDVDTMIAMMDVLGSVKKQNLQLEDILRDESKRKQVIESLNTEYAKEGTTINEEAIISAFDSLASRKYEFKKPSMSPRAITARAYLHRGSLIKNFILAPLLALGILGAAYETISSFEESIEAARETKIEQKVEQRYADKIILEQRLDEISNSETIAQLSTKEKTALTASLKEGKETLSKVNLFFDRYCSNGKAKGKVTRDNYKKISETIPELDTSLKDINNRIIAASDIIQTEKTIAGERKSIEKILAQIKDMNHSEMFMSRAQRYYNECLSNLDKRDLITEKESKDKLSALRADVEEYPILLSSLNGYLQDIGRTAKEEKASKIAKKAYEDIKAATLSANVQQLRKENEFLSEFAPYLAKSFKVLLNLKDPENMRIGWERLFNGVPSKWYLYVYAQDDKTGEDVPMTITDSEDGPQSARKVTIWGEEVPNEIFKRILADKGDDEKVNDSTLRGTGLTNLEFARKKSGYVTWDMVMKDNEGYLIQRKSQILKGVYRSEQ